MTTGRAQSSRDSGKHQPNARCLAQDQSQIDRPNEPTAGIARRAYRTCAAKSAADSKRPSTKIVPSQAEKGVLLRPAYSADLDECRELLAGGKQWMAQYQTEQVERTGIPSIKVGFNRVFGYYLEVTHLHRDKVPDDFIRKQTLKNAERFITPELKEYEEKGSLCRRASLCPGVRPVRRIARAHLDRRQAICSPRRRRSAEIDVLAGLAELARSRN